MLNKLIIFILVCVGFAYAAVSSGSSNKQVFTLGAASKITEPTPITLTAANHVMFRGEVDPLYVARKSAELLYKARLLPTNQDLYLVIDSPGGDIVSGNDFANVVKSLGRPVHTITIFSASMAFNFVQRFGTRYITPSGTLMAHRARVSGIGGQVPGEFLTMATHIYRYVTMMERQNAKRMQLSHEAYSTLVRDEYWAFGDEAVEAKAADKTALIRCDDSLSGAYKETVNSMFGQLTLIWAACPAIAAPLAVEEPEGLQTDVKKALREQLRNFNQFRRSLVREVGQRNQ